jgi:AcrR family transcriptional regulator
MGRPPRYNEAHILEGARHVSAELGPQKLTIAAVAQRTGVPVGSIYHRYASRDEILAALWLDFVEEFQARWLAELDGADAPRAGLAAVRFGCGWVRQHPREARLMLLHRREDFASERWPPSYRRRADALARRARLVLQRYAARLTGTTGTPPDLRLVRFALIDVPTAALRRDVEAGVAPSADVERLVLDTCAYILEQVTRRSPRERRQASGNARRVRRPRPAPRHWVRTTIRR